MNRYGMYLKNGKDLIHLTQQENTEQAIKFFTDIKKLSIVEFNAPFSNTKCEFLEKLSDIEIARVDISKDSKIGPKHKVVVVPTLIIFNNGEEVARFQANIMMQLEATKKEVQGKIDEILMESF